MVTFRPMLACQYDKAKVRWPMLASPKLDGIRCLAFGGVAMARSMKPIRNRYIQAWFKDNAEALQAFDGELIVGPPNAADVFNVTSSAVNSEDGEPDFTYHVFDRVALGDYTHRFDYLRQEDMLDRVKLVPNFTIFSEGDLGFYESKALDEGYEGVMLRHPMSPYKQGRSTPKEAYLLKVKRFFDAEAEIIDMLEEMRNDNPLTTNELGLGKRSSHQGNLIAKGTMGTLCVRGINGEFKGVEFGIGSGFDQATRQSLWDNRQNMLGKVVTYKYFSIGVKDKPRFPVFKGFRDLTDIGE
jgi:DNA ligase-1